MEFLQANGLENGWWAVGLLAVAAFTWFMQWRTNKQVVHQVQNDHETNLRNDIDDISLKLDRVIVSQTVMSRELLVVKTNQELLKLTDSEIEDTQRREELALKRAVQDRNNAIRQLRKEIPYIVEEHCEKKGCDK